MNGDKELENMICHQWSKTYDITLYDISFVGLFRVHLIASVPGAHTGLGMLKWGHMKLRKVRTQYLTEIYIKLEIKRIASIVMLLLNFFILMHLSLYFTKVLQNHGPSSSTVTKDWPVVGQFSSIGSLGPSSSNWLTSEWLSSLATCRGKTLLESRGRPPQLQLVS